MVKELELAVADAAAAEAGRPNAGKPDADALPDRCANCGTELKGRWCYACGQGADDHRRSLGPLIKEGLEGLFHFDGRLRRTLPQLFFRPGALIADFFAGRITRHVPPFRLFLTALFVYFLAIDVAIQGAQDEAARSLARGRGSQAIVVVKPTAEEAAKGKGETFKANPFRATPEERRVIAGWLRTTENGEKPGWEQERLARGIENLDLFTVQLLSWAQRLAILLLPIQAAILALLFIRQKRWFFYDHLIFSMTQLSFCFLVYAIAFVLPGRALDWGITLATLWVPVNLYLAIRGGYGSRPLGAAVKTAVVWLGTLLGFSILLGGLILLSLTEV
jgi:hypothetical protein